MAEDGLARRGFGVERHIAFYRAHGVQGHGNALGRSDCAAGGFDRREHGRLHRQGMHLLQHQSAGRAPADRHGGAERSGAASGVRRRRHCARARRDSRRNQDGSGQSGLPGSRDFHAELLEGPRARAADSGHARDGQEVRAAGGVAFLRPSFCAGESGRERGREPES